MTYKSYFSKDISDYIIPYHILRCTYRKLHNIYDVSRSSWHLYIASKYCVREAIANHFHVIFYDAFISEWLIDLEIPTSWLYFQRWDKQSHQESADRDGGVVGGGCSGPSCANSVIFCNIYMCVCRQLAFSPRIRKLFGHSRLFLLSRDVRTVRVTMFVASSAWWFICSFDLCCVKCIAKKQKQKKFHSFMLCVGCARKISLDILQRIAT